MVKVLRGGKAIDETEQRQAVARAMREQLKDLFDIIWYVGADQYQNAGDAIDFDALADVAIAAMGGAPSAPVTDGPWSWIVCFPGDGVHEYFTGDGAETRARERLSAIQFNSPRRAYLFRGILPPDLHEAISLTDGSR